MTFTIAVTAPSGIDDTASSNDSVYLEWANDGELDVDANTLDLDHPNGDAYQAGTAFGPYAAGTVVSWRVYTEDDDNSRAGAWSEVYTVVVGGLEFE